jgi:hypothetical protein
VTETYVCPNCTATVERPYRVRLIVLTCPECGENGNFLNRTLVELLSEIPEEERPDDWGDLAVDQRLSSAVRRGLLDTDQVWFF